MYALSVSVDVNRPNASPRLSQEQVWRGLVMKAENALPFVPSMQACTLLEQTQAPSGKACRGRREGQRDQFCFRRAVENRPPGGVRVVFAGQHRLEPSSTSWRLVRSTVAMLVSSAAAIRLSLQPSPASDTSAFKRMRAFVSNWAERLPLRINSLSRSRSSASSLTTYFLTAISFPATNHLHRCLAAKAR
jgi:hypothetical protein